MTLLLPHTFYFIFKISLAIMTIAGYIIHYFEQDLPIQLLHWMGYIIIPIISTTLLHCHSFFYGILLIPVYFWNLLWHPSGWWIIDMLQDPYGNGWLVIYNKQEHCHQWRTSLTSLTMGMVTKTASVKILLVYHKSWRKPNHSRLWLKTMFVQLLSDSPNKYQQDQRSFFIWKWCDSRHQEPF